MEKKYASRILIIANEKGLNFSYISHHSKEIFNMNELVQGAKTIVKTCMNIQQNEELLIITDEDRLDISKAISNVAYNNNIKVTQIVIPDEIRPVLGVNNVISHALKHADVILTVMDAIPEETPFRIEIMGLAKKHNKRLGHMPGVERRMFLDGALQADYNEVKKTSEDLLKKFDTKKEIRITSPGGTDLHIKLGKRKWRKDIGLYHKPGAQGNLPAGEIFIAPLENGVNGRLVVDGSIGFFGLPKEPIDILIEKGKIKTITCEDKDIEKKLFEKIFVGSDDNARIVGELGIGTNNYAKLTGNLLEDEKVFGTAHLAFGDNINMGGKNKSKIHIDMIFKEPEFLD